MSSDSNGTNDKVFLLDWTFKAIGWSKKCLPHNLTLKFLKRKSPDFRFVEQWVVGAFGISILAHIVGSFAPGCLASILALLGIVRVLEVVVYNADVALGNPDTKEPYVLMSFRRSLVCSLLGYVEVLFWFAVFYGKLAGQFSTGGELSTFTGGLYMSVLTMATYGDIQPETALARWVVGLHLMISLYLTVIVVARFVSILPAPISMDPKEQKKS